MTLRQRANATAAFFVTALMLITSCMLMSSCTRNQRVDTLRASVQSLDVAREGYVAWDLVWQQAIVADAPSLEVAVTKVAEHRKNQDQIKAGFDLAYRLVALAATSSDEASLKEALRQVEAIIREVTLLANGGTK